MSKIIISEERLNKIIANSINEALEDEGLRDTAQKAWSGIKNGVQKGVQAAGTALRNGYNNAKQGVKNSGGVVPYLAGQAAYAKRRVEQYKNKINQAKTAGRAAADAKALQDSHPANYWKDKYGEDFAAKMGEILSGSYPKDRLIQALNAYKVSPEDQQKILAAKGYPTTGQNTTGQETQGDVSEPAANPDSSVGQNGNGGNQFNIQNPAQYLKNKGFQLINGQWLYTRDGSNHPALQSQYPDIVQAAKQYQAQVQGGAPINEQKIREAVAQALRKYINEN